MKKVGTNRVDRNEINRLASKAGGELSDEEISNVLKINVKSVQGCLSGRKKASAKKPPPKEGE